ncbi:MAG: NAD(P)H-binding protein [Planctomycetes bacterium]|nr:NAD(P)H-binding protein [Planctomycetota bacterium]
MNIAVTSATGRRGRPVVRSLLERGYTDLVLLARSDATLEPALWRGARVVTGDLLDVRYVCHATEGIDVLIWITPLPRSSPSPLEDFGRLGDSAAGAIVANGIRRVVNLSTLGVHLSAPCGVVEGFRRVEGILDGTPAEITHLRPGYLMENYEDVLEGIRHDGAILLPVSPEAIVPMIAAADAADLAAAIATDWEQEGRQRRVFELHGPNDISFGDAALLLSGQLGRDIPHVRIPPEEARERLAAHGFSEAFAALVVEWYAAIDSGLWRPDQPRSPATETQTPFERYVRYELAPRIRATQPIGPR